MLGYKLYFFGDHGHIKRMVDLACDTDEEAELQAESQRKAGPLEVRNGARLVARYPKQG